MRNQKFSGHRFVRKFASGSGSSIKYFNKHGYDMLLLFESKEGIVRL